MKAIPGIEVTAAMVTTNVAEPSLGETVWVSGSYAVGAEVIVVATHRKYSSLAPGASTVSPELDPARWEDIGATNAYAMFDDERNTPTTRALTLTTSVTPGVRFDSCAVIAAIGETMQIDMTVGATTVWSSGPISLQARKTTRWYEYFFGPFKFTGNKIFFNLPPYVGAKITLTVSRTTGNVSVGAFVVGTAVSLGRILKQARSESFNFSSVTRNEFGRAKLVKRLQKPGTTQTLIAPASQIEPIRELRALTNAKVIVWSGLDDRDDNPYFDALLIQGFYKTFEIGLPTDDNIEITLSVEEL